MNQEPARPGVRYRWTVVALLFVATTINYIDRQVLGILAPTLQRELGWSETDYGNIVSWFSLVYAVSFLAAGRILDRVGVKRGLATAVVVWSLAAMAHALARTATAFSIARAMLGLGESAIFPSSIKAIAEWFPARERAFATGLFNAGTNMGAILTPLIVPAIALAWGWQSASIATGALGFLWLLAWIPLYRSPTASEAPNAPEPAQSAVRWFRLLGYRQTWAFAVAKLLADPVWFFYLFWLPKFLDARYGIKLAGLALPLVAVYLTADVGAIAGGWASSRLIQRGWTANRARKATMLIVALIIVPTALVPRADSLWLAVVAVAVAAAAHQAWSTNALTLPSDMFPRSMVGSVTGIGAFAGAMGGVVFQRAIGRVLDANGQDYAPIFLVCGGSYLAAWFIIHALVPRLAPISAPRSVSDTVLSGDPKLGSDTDLAAPRSR